MKTKQEILRGALERIACASSTSSPLNLAAIASEALRDANAVIEYRITARTWYGKSGGEFVAELRRVDTGNIIMSVSGTTWGSDAWSYAIRDKMPYNMPELFPPHNGMHPTIYFREVCRVDYEHADVSRKRDL